MVWAGQGVREVVIQEKAVLLKWLIRFYSRDCVLCWCKMGEFKGMMRGGYSHKCGGCTSMHTGMMSQDRDMMRGGMMGKKVTCSILVHLVLLQSNWEYNHY